MTYYSGINIMLPTRGRPYRLEKFIKSALETSFLNSMNSDGTPNKKLVFTLLIDKDDNSYDELLKDMLASNYGCLFNILVNEDTSKPHLGNFFNRLYEETKWQDPSYLVTMVGDDMVFLTPGWDRAIVDAANQSQGDAIIYCDDDYCQHENLCVNLFVSRDLVAKTKKPFMCSLFPADFIDTVWMEVGKKMGSLRYMGSYKIKHEHSGAHPESTFDDTFKRLRSVYKAITQEDIASLHRYVDEIVSNLKG